MTKHSTDISLFIFAKAPIAGKVKTRLQTNCSAEQAADIAKILLEETLRQTSSHWPGRVIISAALDIQNEFIQALAAKYQVKVIEQGEGNLGQRMLDTFKQQGCPAAIIGSDAPHITAQTLKQAHACLANGENTIGPSDDGGYYLIGLTEPINSLFQDIQWGTDSVLEATLKSAQQHDSALRPLATLNDVDTWADLISVSKQMPGLREFLQAKELA